MPNTTPGTGTLSFTWIHFYKRQQNHGRHPWYSIARRNVKNLRPVPLSFAEIAKDKGYDPETLVSAIVSLVQTSIQYECPLAAIATERAAGYIRLWRQWPRGPETAIPKTAPPGLDSSELGIQVWVVGVAIPQHYLMGTTTRRGDAFIEYQGLTYVLVEASCRPAGAGPLTTSILTQGWDLRIAPHQRPT